ncbi:MAG: ribbon-helix-helix protein, CopG family [Mailhella sp.]|nr:ribbon-helix-helix protein, CopG family [Mailhella sp.]
MFSTSIRLPKEMNDRLTRLAELTGRSKSYYIHEAIYRHLAELEQIYLAENEQIETRKREMQTIKNLKEE